MFIDAMLQLLIDRIHGIMRPQTVVVYSPMVSFLYQFGLRLLSDVAFPYVR